MIRHLFIAAFRSMAASRLLSAISIFGLAIGLATAFVSGLMIRTALSDYHFIPGYERVHKLVANGDPFAGRTMNGMVDDSALPALLRQVSGVESVARATHGLVGLTQGQVSDDENIHWADPEFFRVMPYPTLHGDAQDALRHPDGVVLNRTVARKYFGRENVVGETIAFDGHPMMVRAVLEDVPHQGNIELIFASGRAAFSGFETEEIRGRLTLGAGGLHLRLKPGVAVQTVEAELRRLVAAQDPLLKNAGLVRIDRQEFFRDGTAATRLALAAAIGLLTLFIAAANTINLMVARAGRRQREVGVRKVCGAGRRHLMLQFLGEALVSVAIAALFALMLVEWLLPAVNAFLRTEIKVAMRADLDGWGELALPLLTTVTLTGLAVGAWPAFVLSGFAPANVFKGWMRVAGSAGLIRGLLVTIQFAILVVLAIAAGVIWQQQDFAAHEAIRLDIDQVVIVQGALPSVFPQQVRQLPGVRDARASGTEFIDDVMVLIHLRKGKNLGLRPVNADRGVLAFYGIAPLAGSLHVNPATGDDNAIPGVIITQGAVGKMGLSSPQAALGQTVWDEEPWSHLPIIAVVPDFTLHRVDNQFNEPAVFSVMPAAGPDAIRLLHIRLSGRQIPETLDAIDRLWKQTGGQGAINRYFLDRHMEERYLDLRRQAQMFAFLAGVAIFLACLGLVGVAISTAERRTKEIGVRKAMGATSAEIVTLLLWQFSRPVLLANILAWPAAFWLMQRWLSSFNDHVTLGPGVFIAASALSLAIAFLTVAGQAIMVARRKPVVALRYE